jgi:hypothetical protein
VHRLVAGLFVVESRGASTLKGIERSVELYRVVRPSGVPFSLRNVQQMVKEGGLSPSVVASGLAGLTPEQRALRQTPAQNYIDKLREPVSPPHSPQERQRRQVLGDLEAQLRRQLAGGAAVHPEAHQ